MKKILLLVILWNYSALGLGASYIPASPVSVFDLSSPEPQKRKAPLSQQQKTPAERNKKVHTLEDCPRRLVFPRLAKRYNPLVEEAKEYLLRLSNPHPIPVQSSLLAFFRDYKMTTSNGRAVLSKLPQEFCPSYSDVKLARLVQEKHRHKRSPLEKINGKAPSSLYGNIYNISIFDREISEGLMNYRALKGKKTKLFYDGGNTLWAENQCRELKLLVGEALVLLNERLLKEAGESFAREDVLRRMSLDLNIASNNIVVLPQKSLDYHIDFALIPAPHGALMLKDPKAGSGALLLNKTVQVDCFYNKAQGKILKYFPKDQSYLVRIENSNKLTYEDQIFTKDFFSVEDPHQEEREKVKLLLETHGFKVIPTPMVFPKEDHCVYLTNPVYWKSKETGHYHFMLMGVQDQALRENWASFIREEAFLGETLQIYFLGERSSFKKAESYTIENQAGFHCITFENNNPPLVFTLGNKKKRI